MLTRITSAKCAGIEALPVTVEVNVSNGIGIHLVGLADVAVKESLLRTITALQSMGFKVPGKKIVINLAPADMHKSGSGYDLPIAIGLIAASGQAALPQPLRYVIMGELALDGTVRPAPGALPVAEMAGRGDYDGCILPLESAYETVESRRCRIYGVRNLKEALDIACGRPDSETLEIGDAGIGALRGDPLCGNAGEEIMDFSEIIGQDIAKRGLEIAAAGGHNVMMVGPPGSGKSSLARAVCGILPGMTTEEAVQTTKIYSVAGRSGSFQGLMHTRPFRAIHNTASVTALVGGGSDHILPGEISLAHNGVLFVDEFCEMPRHTVEALRGPLEDRKVTISRLKMKVEYPADFMLVAATNPCPCGFWGEDDRCTCTVGQRQAYLARLSGPIMDRIDIHLWLHPVAASSLVRPERGECSAVVAARVEAARKLQRKRFLSETALFCNAGMSVRQLEKYCPLNQECTSFMEKVTEKAGLSARAFTRVIKLARTIADLDAVERLPGNGAEGDENSPIRVEHLAEAVSYRFLDKRE